MTTNLAAAATSPTSTNLPVASQAAGEPPAVQAPLLRIHGVAEIVGLTTRSIRYYEEVGLLKPAARSECAYRLYDADDLERLHYIKAMRDDAGFSLAEIGRLLEDDQARSRSREKFQATTDPAERRAILRASVARLDRQVATLREKADRLEQMIAGVEGRRIRVEQRLAELEVATPASPVTAARVAPTEPAPPPPAPQPAGAVR